MNHEKHAELAMSPTEAIDELAALREEIEEASEHQDWELVIRIDQEIRDLADAFPKDQRSLAMAQALAAMKASYQQMVADNQRRQQELRGKLGRIRGQREALQGYKNSLAAGNRELRTSA